MVRKTSVTAYHSIKENGHLGKLKWLVYDHLFHHGPLTAKQVQIALQKQNQNSGALTTRLSELRDEGLVEEIGEVKCEHSGRMVIQWDVTDRASPIKSEKPKRIPCPHCGGKGFTQTQQVRMDL